MFIFKYLQLIMQIPIYFYLVEFKCRLFYFLFSFISCLIVIITYHEAIFFFNTYTFYFINNGNFIATHIAELFETSTYISFNISLIINFPFAYYHCSSFLSSSWYKSQVWFFSNLQISATIIFIVSIFASYFWILPYAYKFLDTWAVTTSHAFKIQLEARIETYIYWTFQTACLLSNIIFGVFSRLSYFYLTDNMTSLHIQFRKNKKYSVFIICFIASFCAPSETSMQIVTIFILILLFEFFFFLTCLFFAKNNV